MITPSQLFRIRLKRNGKEQFRAWTSVLDWTVWVYLLIPGLFISGGLYRELWMDMADWADQIPWTILYPIVLFIILMFGRLRIFVEEAERLFLLQHLHWLQVIKRWGILYMLVSKAVILLLPFVVLLPFLWKVERLSLQQFILAYTFTLLIGLAMSLGSHLLVGRFKGWRKWVVESVFLILFGAVYFIPMFAGANNSGLLVISIIGAMLLFIVLLYFTLRASIQFEAEVKNESEARLRSTELLMSQVIESKRLISFRRPIVFRRSQRLFRKSDPSTMLAEMRLKAFLRGFTHIRVWIGFISASAFAVNMVPAPIAAFLLISLPMIGSSWLHLQWRQWFTEPFIAQFPWSEEDEKRAVVLSRFWLLLPAMAIWSAVFGFKLAGLWTVLPAAVICCVVLYGVNRFALRAKA